MNATKINIDGKLVEISLGIPEDEIERNEYDMEDTLDLTNVVETIAEDKKD